MHRLSPTTFRLGLWLLATIALIGLYSSLADTHALAQNAQPAAADQQPADDAAVAPSEKPVTVRDSLGYQMFVKSGTFGFMFYAVLGIFSIVAFAVTIERLVNLRRDKIIPPQFVASLENGVRRGQDSARDFRDLCDRFPSPIASILRSATARAGRPLVEVEKAIEDAAIREISVLRGRNRVLSVIASTAPLVGLLGTVVGMIFAFRSFREAALGADKAELLAEGIYLALMTTAAGLTIAIPCMLLAAWFNSQVEKFFWSMDETLLSSLPSFTRMESFNGTIDAVESESPAPVLAK